MNDHSSFPFLRILHTIEDTLLVFALSVMIISAFLQIVLRNFADTGLFWIDPLLRYLVLWIGLLGAMVATREDNHISVDAVSYLLSPRAKACVRVVTDTFTTVVCLLLTYASVKFIRDEIAMGMVIFGDIPAWIGELILPIAFGVIAVRYLFYLGLHLKKAVKGSP